MTFKSAEKVLKAQLRRGGLQKQTGRAAGPDRGSGERMIVSMLRSGRGIAGAIAYVTHDRRTDEIRCAPAGRASG